MIFGEGQQRCFASPGALESHATAIGPLHKLGRSQGCPVGPSMTLTLWFGKCCDSHVEGESEKAKHESMKIDEARSPESPCARPAKSITHEGSREYPLVNAFVYPGISRSCSASLVASCSIAVDILLLVGFITLLCAPQSGSTRCVKSQEAHGYDFQF